MQKRFLATVAALALVGTTVQAQAIITNGTIKLGVNARGALNLEGGVLSAQGSTTTVGLRLLKGGLEYESTSDGCLCEGWGAAIASGTGAGLTGNQNRASSGIGGSGIVLSSFGSTATTAVSVVTIGGMLKVTHDYHPSTQTNLYEVTVTIENLSGVDLGEVGDGIVYRRVMDWDIEPTAFSEKVKLGGWPAANLLHSSNDGFSSANPFASYSSIGGCGAVDNGNFFASTSCDQGALFDFKFGKLEVGKSIVFKTYYGAHDTEGALLAAMSAVGVEVYSTASCSAGFGAGACPAIHGYGFKGVGGAIVIDPTVPEPSTYALMATGLLGLFAVRRRKK